MSLPIKKWANILAIISGKNQKAVVNPNGIYPIYGSGGIMGYADDYLCESGTTIVGRKGTINNPIFVTERFWNVDTAFGITPGEELNPKYLYYFCRHFNFKELDKSTTIPSLAKRDLLAIEMPVPTLDEQERIVARIEELFSELDNGVETLRKTKQQLAVYRQAVLKDAFDRAGDNHLPLREIIEKPRYGTSKKCSYDTDEHTIPVYRIPNINYLHGTISHDDLKYATFTQDELETLELNNGDILIIRSNGSVSLVGRSAVVTEKDTHGLFAGYLMRLRIREGVEILPQYLNLYLNTHYARYQIEQMAKSTSGVNNINSNEICRISLPVCDVELQKQIIRKIESRLSVCDSIEKTVDTALQQAEAMRQSILKKAFEGKL